MWTDDEIKGKILHKLTRLGKFKHSHTSLDNLPKGFPSDARGRVKEQVEELIKEKILLTKPTGYGLEVSINTEEKDKIVRITYNESPAHIGPLRYAVDFIVPEGTPVLAAADGKVVEVKDDSDMGGESQEYEKDGNYIEIEHTHGEYSEYEHLRKNSVMVKAGDFVKKGQAIAKSGATGWIAHLGPHLHFMVGKYGKTVEEYETLEIQ